MRNLYEKRNRLRGELDELRASYERQPDKGILERVSNVKRGLDGVEREIVAELSKNPENREAGSPQPPTRMASPGGATGFAAEARSAALRAIEANAASLDARAGDRLSDLIERDRFGLDSAYIDAVADPNYEAAFAKRLAHGDGAEATLSADEVTAMQKVGAAMAQRALAVGEGKTGGYAVPLTLDPTVLLTNDGAVNPIRELATVSTIATTKWAGVSSAGVEATFQAEAAAAEDASPELAQPEITPEMARIWVPYSIEVGMDWPGLSAELGQLFSDAKSVKEAEIFATGKGEENIPQGLITGATKLVETATKEVFAAADTYSVEEALAPRWQPRATWLAANKVANQIHKFVAKGDTEEAAIMSEDRKSILGKPFSEVSTMSTKTTTAGEKVLAYGDVSSAFRIVDRIGMTVESVPLVLSEGKPTGQRGLFAFFRVGSKVIIPEAVQVLKVKA